MKYRHFKWTLLLGLMTGLGFGSSSLTIAGHVPEPPAAPGSTWEPETCTDKSQCGDLGGLMPIPTDPKGAVMVWDSKNWEVPMIQFKERHAEMKARDLYDTDCLEAVVLASGYSAWPIPRDEWAAQFPTNTIDLNNIFLDNNQVSFFDATGNFKSNLGIDQCLRSSFKQLAHGGYNVGNRASERLRAFQDTDITLTWDLRHPDAFANRGIYDNALLDEGDALMFLDSLINTGVSAGLHYSIYSLGYASLADGRILHIGGHNLNSNSGFRKLNIFEPETLGWAERPEPCHIRNWRQAAAGVEPAASTLQAYYAFADAFAGGPGLGDLLANPPPNAPTWPNCSMRVRDQVDPPHQSDMRYQRWYPTGVTLPDGRALVLGGVDQDESVGPDETDPNVGTRDAGFIATRVTIPVADLYDPKTDTTVALENARRLYPDTYPYPFAVQTGPRDTDWKLCVLNGQPAPVAEATVPRSDATDDAAEWRNFCDEPGCANDTRAIAWHNQVRPPSSLDCLDVNAAVADPTRNIPAENHWTHIDTAASYLGYCCGAANIVKIGPSGKTISHKIIVAPEAAPDIYVIDFVDPSPTFQVLSNVRYTFGSGSHLVPLPDGTVVLRGGTGPGGPTLEDRQVTKFQVFNPDDGTVKVMAKSTLLSGGVHNTVFLLQDATVLSMTGDRTRQVSRGDRTYSPGDNDLGLSQAQIWTPSYLYADAEGTLKPRPVIEKAPDHIRYRQGIALQVNDASKIKMVSMLRTGATTHVNNPDNMLVILNFKRAGNNLVVDAPHHPAQAVPGDYMLFVVNNDGTPSMAKHVRLHL